MWLKSSLKIPIFWHTCSWSQFFMCNGMRLAQISPLVPQSLVVFHSVSSPCRHARPSTFSEAASTPTPTPTRPKGVGLLPTRPTAEGGGGGGASEATGETQRPSDSRQRFDIIRQQMRHINEETLALSFNRFCWTFNDAAFFSSAGKEESPHNVQR